MRFLKDIMLRYSRQVLTAGKADEPVSDAGDSRKGHSIFTSNLLDALKGAAATSDGIISANGVMAYVYEKVSQAPQSKQTPHYGFDDGDGDLILSSHVVEADATVLEVKKPTRSLSWRPPTSPTGRESEADHWDRAYTLQRSPEVISEVEQLPLPV